MLKSVFTAAVAALSVLTAHGAVAGEEYWHNCPHLKLFMKNNRGWSGKTVMRRMPLKVVNPRPKPTAKFFASGRKNLSGKLDGVKIPVTIKDDSGVARTASVRTGIPFPAGSVFKPEQLRLVDSSGKVYRAQFSITGFWSDDSVKWALLQFSVPLKANEEKKFFVVCSGKDFPDRAKAIKVTDNADKLTVDTGKIKAVINKKNFNLIESLFVDGKFAGSFSKAGATLIEDSKNKKYTLSGIAPESIEVAEQGAEHVTIRVAGRYGAADKSSCMNYVARLHFFAGVAGFEVEFTHINTELMREFTDLQKLNMEFVPAAGISSASSGTESSRNILCKASGRIFQETDEFYTIDSGKREKGKITGCAALKTEGGDFWSVGVAEAWQRYPKALSWNDKQLTVELLPEQGDKNFNRDLPYYLCYPFCEGAYRMKWGMSFTERIRFEFGSENADGVYAELNYPVVAKIPEKWFAETKALPGLDTPGFENSDKKLIKSFEMRLNEQISNREYGYFNYGDSFGEKGENWTNNEYDLAHGYFMAFLRTGDNRFYREALRAARHQANVDIIQAYPDPYYVGGNHTHRAGHVGGYKIWSSKYNYYSAASNGHTWTYGLLNAWHLAGDARVMDAALLSGDHIALAMAPNFKLGKNPQAPRECSWALRAIIKMYEATLDPVYLDGAKKLAEASMNDCNANANKVWTHVNSRLVRDRGDHTPGNVVFIAGVGLKGLCEYYNLTRDERAKTVIGNVAKQIVKAFDIPSAGFAYDISHDGRKLNYSQTYLNYIIAPALADAAVILNDEELFDVARRAMMISFVRYPGCSGKAIGEHMTFLSDYLQALKNFPGAGKQDFSELGIINTVLSKGDVDVHWRGAAPGTYSVRLKKPEAGLKMQRWIWPGKKKHKPMDSKICIYDPAGKLVEERKFDSSLDAMRMEFDLRGKPGDEFKVTVNDYPNADWGIVQSDDYLYALTPGGGKVQLIRNGLTKIYFEVKAGEKVSLFFYGTHIGGYGGWLLDDDGRVVSNQVGFNSRTALSREADNVLRFDFPVSDKRKVYSFVSWSEHGSVLRMSGDQIFSIHRKYFAE